MREYAAEYVRYLRHFLHRSAKVNGFRPMKFDAFKDLLEAEEERLGREHRQHIKIESRQSNFV